MCKSYSSLAKFIPKYFILFDAIVSGLVFLISISEFSLIVCRNMTNFSILIPVCGE